MLDILVSGDIGRCDAWILNEKKINTIEFGFKVYWSLCESAKFINWIVLRQIIHWRWKRM